MNKSIGTIADSITWMERSEDKDLRPNVQGRRSNARVKRPRLETKENQTPKISSVVKDLNKPRRSGKNYINVTVKIEY